MEWAIIPGILVMMVIITILLGRILKWNLAVILIGLSFFSFISIMSCSTNYYITKNNAIAAEIYYSEILLPQCVQEEKQYIVVSNLEAGIWQAGEMNLPRYNAYLKTTRYWDSVPIIGMVIYRPPEYLKYARIMK